MRKYGLYLALTGATVCLIGFGVKFSGSSSHGGIAVVDLDKVAAETGKSLEMRDALERQQNFFRQELAGVTNQAQAQLNAKIKKITDQGDTVADADKRDAVLFKNKADSLLAQYRNEAGTKLNQMQQVQIAKFRAELKPIIQEAATRHGLSVVIPKNDGLLLAVQPGADITDEVIKAYQKRPVQAAAPAVAAPTAPAAAQTAPNKSTRTVSKDPKDSDGEAQR